MAIGKYELQVTGKATAYLRLPSHPGELHGARSVPLVSVMGAYDGPYIVFDFDESGTMVGIEIVAEDSEEEEDDDDDGG